MPAEVTPVPAEVTPVPAEVTPVPAEVTPVPAEVTPVPAEATPVPAEVTPVPAEATPVPAEEIVPPQEENPSAPADAVPPAEEIIAVPPQPDPPSEPEPAQEAAVPDTAPAEGTVETGESAALRRTGLPVRAAADPGNLDAINSILQSQEYRDAQAALAELDAELAELGISRYDLPVEAASVNIELITVRARLAAIDAILSSIGLTRESLPESVEEMENGLAQAEEGIALLTDALAQLDSGVMQLGGAQAVLSSVQSGGILELADGAAQIAINSAALENALAQVDSGLASIEDAREDALAAADISANISLNTITAILSAQNFSMPAGYVAENGIHYMVSVGDKLTDAEELEDLLLFDTGEKSIGPVFLKDVSDVFVTDDSDETYARLDGENGLILSFEKQSNAATANVTDSLNERFRQLEEAYPGLHFVSLMNQGDYIYMIVNSILESLLAGAVFAILILILFLRDWRPTVITLVAIPLSVV
ncbi:MAG: efflux RND transporter permease subunit, partial [Oscillospiraceae bacterium]|nr:efflux RND transporter permease subunit [Oscillospiraceae bacterium]